MRKTILIASLILISGCSVGIAPGGQYPPETFTTPTTYQEAFRRAEMALRECHSGSNPFMRAVYVNGNVYSDKQTASLRVTMDGWTNDMVRVGIVSGHANTANVSVTVWGGETWDEAEIAAIKASIETGTVVCRKPQYRQSKAGNAY